KKSTHLNNTTKGFGNGDSFVRRVDKLIRRTYDETFERAQQGEFELPDEEKQLSGVSIFIPGTTMTKGKDDIIAFMPNVRDTKGKSLTNIDFTNYENGLKTHQSLKPEEEPLDVSDDFELFVTKDLGGTGLGIAKVLGEKGMLKNGDYIMGIMTGGGFGSVDLKVKDDRVEIETCESSSYLTANPGNGNPQKLGRLGVSVKSHINHFCNALGIPELAEDSPLRKAMITAGDARIVEDNVMYISNRDKELIDTFKGSELFRVNKDKTTSAKTCFEMVDDDPDFALKMKQARISSVKDYAYAVSLISINKINDFVNKIILVGPFAHGVNRYVKEHPEEFSGAAEYHGKKVNGLADLITHEIDNRIESVDLPTSGRLKKLNNVEVICDDSINISDNTYAGDILLDPELKFVENRGNWFSFPLNLVQKEDTEE
ncbi:hypothetical protein II906_05790, partial [bacterium]|nr:hypothetical protein [bacterium]